MGWLADKVTRNVMPVTGNAPLCLRGRIAKKDLKLSYLKIFILDEYVKKASAVQAMVDGSITPSGPASFMQITGRWKCTSIKKQPLDCAGELSAPNAAWLKLREFFRVAFGWCRASAGIRSGSSRRAPTRKGLFWGILT